MMLFTCNWFQALDKTKYFDETGDHADEMETSIIMHLHPELVLPLDQAGDGAEKKSKIKGIQEKWAWAERKWSEVTEDTGIGNPKKSSPEKGKKYFEDVTDKVAQLMLDICEAKAGSLYK